jgi:hypothetical protein
MQLNQPVLNVKALLIYFPAAFEKKCPHHEFAVDHQTFGSSRASNFLNFNSASIQEIAKTYILQCRLLEAPVSLSSRLSLQPPEASEDAPPASHSHEDRNI